jgi:ABC-type Mn2+/Zn2+ transport system ATPase subunit
MILPAGAAASDLAIDASDVSVIVAGRRLLDKVSLRVPRGMFACLCGPNGGGKTTFLRVLLGLVPPDEGTVRVLGETPGNARAHVGYLPQRKSFSLDFPASAAELILAQRRGAWPLRVAREERERARQALARVGGEGLLDKPLRGLSGGEAQRVFLARALVNEPALLLLDEPTAGVDAQGRAEFLDLLASIAARDDMAAVLVTHHQAAVHRLAERVALLNGRLLAWGKPEEVLLDGDQHGAFGAGDHDPAALCEGA